MAPQRDRPALRGSWVSRSRDRTTPRGVPQGSWSVGLEGLTGMVGLPGGAATKGSAGAEAAAQGSSELSATSIIAPSRLLLAGWAAPDGGRVDGVWQPRDWA